MGDPLPRSVLVVSDVAGLVQLLSRDGSERWRRRLRQPRGVSVEDGRVYVGNGREVLVLDLDSGRVIGRFAIDGYVEALRVHGGVLALSLAREGANAVQLFRISAAGLERTATVSEPIAYARGLEFDAERLFVADTYGHRIVAFDVRSLERIWELESFFPNSVHLEPSGRLVVAEEHLNRIAIVDRDGGRVGIAASCATVDGIPGVHAAREAANAPGPDGQSPCRVSTARLGGLFSPNDAWWDGAFLYVADTDNHRVVVMRENRVLTSLDGFNSPVHVVPVDHR